ncbi:MAG: PaaI family thioesterase [bacterium]
MSLYDSIGLTLEPWTAPGRGRASIPIAPAVLNPNEGVHGGAVAALADTTAAHAVRSLLGDPQALIYTVELSLSFLRPLGGTRVHAEGEALRVGRRLAFAEARIRDDAGALCATAKVTFSIPSATRRERTGS